MIKVEYKKIRTSIFDLKDAFESGELYMRWGESYSRIETERALKQASIKDNVFVRNKRKLTIEEQLKERGYSIEANHFALEGEDGSVIHVSFDEIITLAAMIKEHRREVANQIGVMEYVKC